LFQHRKVTIKLRWEEPTVLSRKNFLLLLAGATLAVMPYVMTVSGPVPQSAAAKDGKGNGGSGGKGDGGGQGGGGGGKGGGGGQGGGGGGKGGGGGQGGGGGGKGGGSGSKGSGGGGDKGKGGQTGEDDAEAKAPSSVLDVSIEGPNILVKHPNGMREKVQNGRYEMLDSKGRRIVNRTATNADRARLRRMTGS
jgi:hypothetical protein